MRSPVMQNLSGPPLQNHSGVDTFSVGEEMREFMRGRGRDLATYHGNDAWMLPIPATFVLDRHGRIVMRHVNPDYRRRATIDDIMAAVRRLSA
jgi:hypothetical protein